MNDCCRHYIDSFKQNNADLSKKLNASLIELCERNEVLNRKAHEYQLKCDENAQLRVDLKLMETQLATLKTHIAEVVKNNTRGLCQLMGLLSGQTTAVATNNDNGTNAVPTRSTTPPSNATAPPQIATAPPQIAAAPQTGQFKPRTKFNTDSAQRRHSLTLDRRTELPNLAEEKHVPRSSPRKRSASSDTNSSASDSSTESSSPETSPNRYSRRIQGHTPTSPSSSSSSPESPSPLRQTVSLRKHAYRRNSIPSPKMEVYRMATDNAKKTIQKDDLKSEKENDVVNGDPPTNGRPRRKAAPAHLKEEKLNVKLRRKR